MKKNLCTSKIKTILIVAVALAIVTTVIVAVSANVTAGENLVGTILSPFRSAVAAIDRQAVRLYNYIFSYEAILAENEALKAQILDMEEDVRTAQEFADKRIPDAINIPNETIGTEDIPELPDKDQLILVYCRSGNRSKQASEKLAALGYTNIVEFGGINDWPGETVSDSE